MAVAVVAVLLRIGAVMLSTVAAIVVGTREVIVIVVGIDQMHAEVPTVAVGIDGATEVLGLHKPSVLRGVQDPTEVVITQVEAVVVTIHRATTAIQYIVHQVTDVENEVVVDFIHIIVLPRIQIQLIAHSVRKEAGFFTYPTVIGRSRARAAYDEHQQGGKGK